MNALKMNGTLFFTTIPPLMYYVFVPKVFSTLDFVKKIPGEHDYKMFLQI